MALYNVVSLHNQCPAGASPRREEGYRARRGDARRRGLHGGGGAAAGPAPAGRTRAW